MIIIGVTGRIASGADEFGGIAKERGYGWASYSDCLRGLLTVWERKIVRGSLQDLADLMRSRNREILSEIVHAQMSDGKNYCAGNIRNPSEVLYFRGWEASGDSGENRKFRLVEVVADPKIRFERAKVREAKRREGDPLTWDEFLIMEAKDLGEGQPSYGQQHGKVFKMADYRLENNCTLDEYKDAVYNLLTRIESGE